MKEKTMRPPVAAAVRTSAGFVKVTRRSFIASRLLRQEDKEPVQALKIVKVNCSAPLIRKIKTQNQIASKPHPSLASLNDLVRKSLASPWAASEEMKSWRLEHVEQFFRRLSKAHAEDKVVIDHQQTLFNAVKKELSRRLTSARLKAVRKREDVGEAVEKAVTEKTIDCLWLRDACDCSICVDPSSKQKSFQTTDIPFDLAVDSEKFLSDGSLQVTWKNDIPGIGSEHVSTYSREFLTHYCGQRKDVEARRSGQRRRVHWNNATISEAVTVYDYDSYMSSDDVLYDALEQLRIYGLIFLRGIPESSGAVEAIGGRIGNLRDTFYGRTWNVKSVSQAKNVAYTSVELGFHMDLLYMIEPPGFQLLHCLKNSCEGGNSLFSDSFFAAEQLLKQSPDHFRKLYKIKLTYHYHNAGQHYRRTRPVFLRDSSVDSIARADSAHALAVVNYSPPFQAPWVSKHGILNESMLHIREGFPALSAFANRIEDKQNIFEYKLKEGECAIFNNRRVLHARSAFDVNSGERWLKGAYVDTDVFRSRLRVLDEERNGLTALRPSDGSSLDQLLGLQSELAFDRDSDLLGVEREETSQ